jgi:hypothetical protein
MMCGEFEHVIIDVKKRPIEGWIVSGDYETDREYRRRFHRWLGDIWEEKDRRITELMEQAS